MNSKRNFTVNVSMSNIKSSVEAFLRQIKFIKNSEDIKELKFNVNLSNITLKEWEKLDVVPINIIIEEEVELIKLL